MLVVRHDLNRRAGATGDLEERDRVRAVLADRGEDPVAGGERDRVEDHVPGTGRVLDDGDLVGLRADEPPDRGVDPLDPLSRFVLGLVPADQRLPFEMGLDHVQHGAGRRRVAGVVEVDDLGAGGCLGAQPRQGGLERAAAHRRPSRMASKTPTGSAMPLSSSLPTSTSRKPSWPTLPAASSPT